jgi:hypothetical protein
VNLPRIIVLLSAAAFAVFGVLFLVAPTWIAGQVDLHLLSATARTEVRAFYGGLELGTAAFLALCAQRESWHEAGLAATAMMLGGAAFCRAASMLFGAPVASIHYLLLVTEAAGALLALWGLGVVLGIARTTPLKY